MTEERTGEKILDYIFNQLDLKTIIDTSIMNSLTKEAKDKLVGEIVNYLSSKKDSSWSKETVLESIFKESITPAVSECM